MMDQEKSELVCFSSGDEEEDEQGVRKKAEEPNVLSPEALCGSSRGRRGSDIHQGGEGSKTDQPTAVSVVPPLQLFETLDELFAQDPALFDKELEQKLAANDVIGKPKITAATKTFQRAVELSSQGKCTWLDSEDDSEDDEDEKAWKRENPNFVDELSSDDDSNEEQTSQQIVQ